MKPGPRDDFLLEQSTKDYDSGFCTPPLRWAELSRHVKGKPFRLIPRCVITQASGKKRVIDNADHGGQSELSSDANKLVLCSALRPAQHIAVAMRGLSPEEAARLLEEDQWEGGGEDWPDAQGLGTAGIPGIFWAVVRLASGSHELQPTEQVHRGSGETFGVHHGLDVLR